MKKLIFISLLALLSFPSFAQRTAKGTMFVDLTGGTEFSSWAAGINGGYYNMMGYYFVGASMDNHMVVSQYGSKYSYAHIVANLGYMYRFLGNQKRTLNAYAGGNIMLGMEWFDPFGMLPKDEPLGKSNKFLYGIEPRVAFEWFWCKTIALVCSASMPVNINSQVRVVDGNLLAGLRFNF